MVGNNTAANQPYHQDTDQYVDVIALGEEDDYYVKLSSGKEYWNIPGKLADRCWRLTSDQRDSL